jgi:hypothetical protein
MFRWKYGTLSFPYTAAGMTKSRTCARPGWFAVSFSEADGPGAGLLELPLNLLQEK